MYSDTRKKPKNAVIIADHSISLSSYILEELNKLNVISSSICGMIGDLFLMLYLQGAQEF